MSDSSHQGNAGVVVPLDAGRESIGDHDDAGGDDDGFVDRAADVRAVAVHWGGLPDVERLAFRHLAGIVDEHDEWCHIGGSELTSHGAPQLSCSENDDRPHDGIVLGEMSRVCVVTGGTRGIGFAIASALLARGDAVAIAGTSAQHVERAAGRLSETQSARERVLATVCDVRRASDVDALFAKTAETFGGIDVLVNNAGVGVGAPVADLSHDEWDRIIGTNLTGVFYCSKSAIPHLRRRGGGWIISISSLASKNPFAGAAAYCASKAALNAFSEALMQEVRQENIRVSYILPGSVSTEFSGRTATAGADWRLHAEDVAQVVVDLLEHPGRSLPSRIELRPSRPQKS